jgi:hypothetical protein
MAQYSRLTNVNLQSATCDVRLVAACDDLMKIAADATRHGLTVISIAARPVPRVYAINPHQPLDAA